ncbi:hypothetical protein MWU49_02560 [Alcanivorax sp. S6407]|uniref:DUF6160 family protein n=1 Tax=Alcanivorax sp. S6407 TaxID=2926424 RepID=UPI001FF66933|nr:DUF6160 family protein [Alcanivorax sp. S6407]MCK0152574.1 hypothetical protein [Alcanivorax sp. S6407]
MGFKKLALAAAVAAAPMSALALEPMQDEALSGVTGQDGITIALDANIVANLIIHDTDGIAGFADTTTTTTTTNTYNYTTTGGGTVIGGTTLPGTATSVTTNVNTNTNVNPITNTNYNNAGALVMSGFGITTPGEIVLKIDAGDSATSGTEPTLNVNVAIPTGTVVNLGSLDVANSNREGAATDSWGTDDTARVNGVLNLGSMTLGATTMNIQLANEPQGDMIALNTTISNGISLSNFSINDAGGSVNGGSISVGELSVINTGDATGLLVDAGINVADNGLVIRVDELGNGGADIRMSDVVLGDATQSALGDIELTNLQLGGTTVRIVGH